MSSGTETPDLGGAAAKGSAITLVSQAVRIGLHLTTIVVLARFLSPDDFGLVAMVMAIVGVSEVVRDLGLSTAAIQAPSLSQAQKSNLFWLNASSGLFFAVLVFLLATPIALLYDEPDLVIITQVVSVIYLVNGLAAQSRAELNRNLRFVSLSAVDVIAQATALLVAIVLAVTGAGFWALVAQQLTYSIGGFLLSAVLAKWVPGLPRRRSGTKGLVTFGIGVTGTQAVAALVRSADTIAIGLFYSAAATGNYNRAYQLVMAPLSQIAAPLTRVALPILSRAWKRDPALFDNYLQKAQLVGCYVTATIYCLVVALAAPLVTIALGEEWLEVVPILQALAAGGVFRAITQISYWAYLSRGESGKQFRVYAIFQPVLVLSVVAGLPWGPVGVAIGSSIGAALYWVISLVMLQRNLGVRSLVLARKALAAIVTVGLPMGVVAWASTLVTDLPFLQIGLAILASGLYLALMYVVNRRTRADIQVLSRFGKRAFTR